MFLFWTHKHQCAEIFASSYRFFSKKSLFKQDCSYQGNALNVPTAIKLVSNSFWLIQYFQNNEF